MNAISTPLTTAQIERLYDEANRKLNGSECRLFERVIEDAEDDLSAACDMLCNGEYLKKVNKNAKHFAESVYCFLMTFSLKGE